MGNIFVTVSLKNRHVLNADTEFTGQIDAGFCGSNRIFGHGIRISGIGVGCLMNFQTQAVAIAVAEVGTVAGIGNPCGQPHRYPYRKHLPW